LNSTIVVHPKFDRIWPWAADHFHELWRREGEVEFIRLADTDTRPLSEIVARPSAIQRLVNLDATFTPACAAAFSNLKECVLNGAPADLTTQLSSRGVRVYKQTSEGFWGQSVAEFGLALTLCGLRRIPQTHHSMLTKHDDWHYEPPEGKGRPGARGQQYGDDSRFTNGTIAGKRIRIVGAETLPAATPVSSAPWAPMWPRGIRMHRNRAFTVLAPAASCIWNGWSPTRKSSCRWCR
jgi:lactate dehydrogenase-like 2-hydroxyacid dehydrogenase